MSTVYMQYQASIVVKIIRMLEEAIFLDGLVHDYRDYFCWSTCRFVHLLVTQCEFSLLCNLACVTAPVDLFGCVLGTEL